MSSVMREHILAELRQLKATLFRQYGVTKLALFGSVARDQMGPDSDIDVVVTLREPDMFALVHIKDLLEQELHRRVDVIHFSEGMNPFLKSRILAEALDV